MTAMTVLRLGLRFGWASGMSSGVLVGWIGAVIGSLVSGSRPDLLTFVSDAFLLMLILLPLFFYLKVMANPAAVADRPVVIRYSYSVSVLAWISSLVVGVVGFMIPALIGPLLLNKVGLTFANASDWFRDVEAQLLGWRGVVVALLTLVGFGIVAYTFRVNNKAA